MTDLIAITIIDLRNVFKQHSRPLLLFSSTFAFVIFCTLLFFKDPQYHAEATFRSAPVKNEELKGFRTLFKNLQFGNDDFDAIPLMFSRRLLTQVIKESGLQISVNNDFHQRLFTRSINNLRREFGGTIAEENFSFRDVDFSQERKETWSLVFSNATLFSLFDANDQCLGQGIVGKKLTTPSISFVLTTTPPNLKLGKKYQLHAIPHADILKDLLTSLEIRPSKITPRILTLIFEHQDRAISMFFLNRLMAAYQRYLSEENEEMVSQQLQFLEKRCNHLNLQLKSTMQDYANYLKKNLKENGVMGLSQQVELTAVPFENEYLEKLSKISLEKKQFEKKENPRFVQIVSPYKNLKEFHGLSKETARELHTRYTQEFDRLQVRLQQLEYLLNHMGEPFVELSSLSNILNDPTSQELIKKATELGLLLRDDINQSERDLARIQEALCRQKNFLQEHLSEMVHLEKIHARILEEKILFLKTTTLELIENEEKQLLKQLGAFREQVADFPEKWLLENELDFKKETTQKVIESMAQFSESKVMEQLLFQVESKPLDMAFASIKPNHPHLFFFSFIAALCSFCFLFTIYLFRAISLKKLFY